jgi:DNA-binding MarR family transcriptional regulator
MTKGKIESKCYVEIDKELLHSTGEIKIIGKPIDVAEQEQKTPRGGFEIAYMSALFDIFDKLGGKRYSVLQYLLKNKDGMNCLNITNSELAEKVGCSRPVVIETMKILTDAGLVVRKGTVIRLSARVFVKGDAQKEAYIMRKFVEEQEKDKQIKGQLEFTDTDLNLKVV